MHDGGATCLAAAAAAATAAGGAVIDNNDAGIARYGSGSAGSQSFVTGGRDGVARLWDLRAGYGAGGMGKRGSVREEEGRRNCVVEMGCGDGGEWFLFQYCFLSHDFIVGLVSIVCCCELILRF